METQTQWERATRIPLGFTPSKKKARFSQSIAFSEEDMVGVAYPHNDALVIVDDIVDFDVKRVLVDGGSAANVLTWDAFLGLKISQEKLKMVITPVGLWRVHGDAGRDHGAPSHARYISNHYIDHCELPSCQYPMPTTSSTVDPCWMPLGLSPQPIIRS